MLYRCQGPSVQIHTYTHKILFVLIVLQNTVFHIVFFFNLIFGDFFVRIYNNDFFLHILKLPCKALQMIKIMGLSFYLFFFFLSHRAWDCFVRCLDHAYLGSLLSHVIVALLPLIHIQPKETAAIFHYLIIENRYCSSNQQYKQQLFTVFLHLKGLALSLVKNVELFTF